MQRPFNGFLEEETESAGYASSGYAAEEDVIELDILERGNDHENES